jgi:hypothetical protein
MAAVDTDMTQTFPLLPLRDIVVFPGMVVPLFVGRDKSVAALEAAMEASKDIVLLAQLDPGCDDPEGDDLYVSKTIAGQLTNVEPTEPHHSDVIGQVAIVGGPGVGSIFVSIRRHQDLEGLADVDGVVPVAGSVLVHDGSVWQARLPMWYDGEPLSYNDDTLYY